MRHASLDRGSRSTAPRLYSTLIFSFLVLFLSEPTFLSLPSADATPGQGVIAIYYETLWDYPITVFYEGDGLPYRNLTMQRSWGPESRFHSSIYKYIEIGASTITNLYFQNASMVNDTRDGEMWSFEFPGVFAIFNDTTNETLSYFWPGCPGQPAAFPVEFCSSHGVCNNDIDECQCDSGWSCPACECYDGCDMVQHAHIVGDSNRTIPQIYESRQCCTMCAQLGADCVAAVYSYDSFLCQIYGSVRSVENNTMHEPPTVVIFPSTAPPFPSPVIPDPSNNRERLYIYVGSGLGIVLLLGLLVVRMVTGERRAEEYARLLAERQEQLRLAKSDSNEPFLGKYKVIRELGRGAFGVVLLVVKRGTATTAGSGLSPNPSSLALTEDTSLLHAKSGSPRPTNGTATASASSPSHVDLACNESGGGSEHALATHRSTSVAPPAIHYYAMKVIHCQSEDDLVSAFREFQSLRKLQGHPNIVDVTEMFMSCETGPKGYTPGWMSPPSTAHGRAAVLSSRSLPQDKRREHLEELKQLEQEWRVEQRKQQQQKQGNNNSPITSAVETPLLGSSPSDTHNPAHPPAEAAGNNTVRFRPEEEEDDDEDSTVSTYAPTRYLCLVMEYYPEGTLDDAMRRDPFPISQGPRVMSITQQILSAIAFSHKKNLIHRDLKPGNVLMTQGGTHAIVTDFGLARDLDKTATEAAGVGTLHFLAPEQMDNRVSKKSDIWSIACIAVAMAMTRAEDASTRAMFMLRGSPDFERSLLEALVGPQQMSSAALAASDGSGVFVRQSSPSLGRANSHQGGQPHGPPTQNQQQTLPHEGVSPSSSSPASQARSSSDLNAQQQQQQPSQERPRLRSEDCIRSGSPDPVLSANHHHHPQPHSHHHHHGTGLASHNQDDDGDDENTYAANRFVPRPAPANHQYLPMWFAALLIRMLQTVSLDRPTAEECLAVFEANGMGSTGMEVRATSETQFGIASTPPQR